MNDFVKPKDQREFIRFGLARIFVQASAIELAHIAERSRKCQKEIALLRTFQCAVFLLHFGHSPCSTYEASVILYPSGTPASGTGTERRHTVCPQRTQRKWTWRSCNASSVPSPHWQPSAQSAYLVRPVPSSMVCTRCCSSNRRKARKMPDLSTVPSRASRSVSDNAPSASAKARATIRRTAVGLMPRCERSSSQS